MDPFRFLAVPLVTIAVLAGGAGRLELIHLVWLLAIPVTVWCMAGVLASLSERVPSPEVQALRRRIKVAETLRKQAAERDRREHTGRVTLTVAGLGDVSLARAQSAESRENGGSSGPS